ncbi:hypothetical protein C8R47DRAFT_1151286 [Mycena vitilis]|nr:hypothetical protein C8R47DRAFT_1151286 [Mycena vitilis]
METSFTAQLASNYCPTDQELLEIQALLVGPTLQMKRLDKEIACLQKTIDRLAGERDELTAFVHAHKALTSPVRRLPLDIVQEIFIACLPTHRNCVMSASEVPVLLGRICSSWRAISISTPRLWASLHIVRPSSPHSSEPQSFEKKFSQRLETLKAWLRRSGNCPLSISLEDRVDVEQMPDTSVSHSPDAYLQALIPFASRWREVKFSSQGPRLRETLSSLAARDVPILHELAIYDRLSWAGDEGWASIGIFGALELSKFSLSAHNLSSTELPVRWSQLTSLSLSHLGWASQDVLTTDGALLILSQCSVLRICRLTLDHYSADEDSVGPVVECSLLDEMHLSCQSDPASTLPRLFHRLSLPGLRKFVLRGARSPNTLSVSSFLAAVTRLEILDISANAFTEASVTQLLHGLPTIQQLHIKSDVPGADLCGHDIFELLTPSRDLPFLCCPALRVLVIRQSILASDATLLRFINARMAEDSPSMLRRVEASFLRERQVDILPALRQFQDTGFRVSLRYIKPAPSEFSPWLGVDDESSSSEDVQLWGGEQARTRGTVHYEF